MLHPGKAVKVAIYLSEGARHRGVPAYTSILDFLFYRGVAGATVTKGIAGFGADHHMHSATTVEIADRLPLKIEFIDTREKVEALLGKLQELAGTGLIETQETTVVKPAQRSRTEALPTQPHLKIEGKAQIMRIYLNEEDRWKNKPLHLALVEAMRANDIAGVTVFRSMLSYASHRPKREKGPQTVMLSAIDSAEKLRAFLPTVEQMIDEALVVFSDADIIRYAYRRSDPVQPGGEG